MAPGENPSEQGGMDVRLKLLLLMVGVAVGVRLLVKFLALRFT